MMYDYIGRYKNYGGEIHVLDAPVVVERSKLLDYVRNEALGEYGVFSLTKEFTDEAGKKRTFKVLLRAYAFRDEHAVVSEVIVTAKTGYRKYGEGWADTVYKELCEMQSPPEARVMTTDNISRVLVGLDKDKGEFLFSTIIHPAPGETVLLAQFLSTSTGRMRTFYEYGGTVYTDILLSKEELVKNWLGFSLESSRHFSSAGDYICVDDRVYRSTGVARHKLRFNVHTTLFGRHATVEVVVADSEHQEASLPRTLEEARTEVRHCENKDEALAAIQYLHPDLEGDPIPQIDEGDIVVIQVDSSNDPKAVLNGTRGKVLNEHDIFVTVEFLGYSKFQERFRKIDVKRISAANKSNEVEDVDGN